LKRITSPTGCLAGGPSIPCWPGDPLTRRHRSCRLVQ
jgi:hypothetical protein